MQSKAKNTAEKDALHPLVITSGLITIIISVISLIFSIVTYFDMIDSKPLNYYVDSSVVSSSTDSKIDTEIKLSITSGTLNSVKIIAYQNEEFDTIAGGIYNFNKRDDPIWFTISYDVGEPLEKAAPFSYALYVLTTGSDGSETLGMMRYHIADATDNDGAITMDMHMKYYTFEDILLAEQSEDEQQYAHLFSNYRTLLSLLRETGDI